MPKTGILLIDHGSVRAEANAMLEDVVRLVRGIVGPDVVVRSAHLELAPPTIAQGFAACVEAGATEVIVHPYMLSPGRHSMSDVPRLVAEAAAGHPGITHRVTEPLGVHPMMAEMVLHRCGLTPGSTRQTA
jgi:sirohydrochlorin ferrochelatase